MTLVPFAAWRPDVAYLNSQFASDVVNVLPAAGFYIPFQSLESFTDAVSAQPLGGITVRMPDGGVHIFVGTAEALWKLDTSTLAWEDVTQAATTYGATVDERWRFRSFGEYVVAVNINDAPQVYQIGTSTDFADLGGSPPNARNIAVCGDHLALFDDDTMYWSDTNDIGNWSTLNSGSQTFPDGGLLQGSSDATNPIIFQKGAIRLGTFVPGSLEVFTFQKIHDQRGCAAQYSIASRGAFTFFADAGAFYQIAPDGQIIPIGAEKVDRTTFAEISGESLAAIYGEVDPFHNRVYFAVRVNSTGDNFDRLLVYDWQIGEWTRIDINMGILFPLASGTIGYTLDGLDALYASIDAMEISLDSNVWKGGSPTMGALDENFKLGFFSGPNAEATLTTSEMGDLFAVSLVDSISPAVDTNDLVVSIGSRMKRGDTVAWTSEISPSSATGRIDKLVAARFHTFRMRIPAGTDWNAAQGISVSSKPAGMR